MFHKILLTLFVTGFTLHFSQVAVSEEVSVMPNSKQQEIFKAIVAAQSRATNEADQKYSVDVLDQRYKPENVNKNIDLNDELRKKYQSEVRQRYGISEEQEGQIVEDGVKHDWPKK